MVFKRTSMKRKRKVGCTSPILDESPKRTKVHAQRKFAQGSNINSPVITPIKEIESEIPKIDVMPEPVELLPIKRPNTEDFLTFLCFRGTPILPPSLNFFNTASIVDTNGQVHEIKSESPKNGPIDIAKCGTSSEKPFIAFGVRKRADPIVISRQMDRKRRHALALQALRRKYQEQKMAKIRALTISKLSEKVTNKTLVRTNTVSKTETVTKKNNTLQKTKVVATKHVKVTTQTLKTTLRPKIKPRMCLRSFQGRFVQKELPFRKKVVTEKKIIKKPIIKKVEGKKKTANRGDGDEETSSPAKEGGSKSPLPKIVKKPVMKPSARITRSGISNNKINVRRQIKKIILLTAPNNTVKPRSLRSTTIKKTVLSQRKSKTLKAKQKIKAQQRIKPVVGTKSVKSQINVVKKVIKPVEKRNVIKSVDLKKEVNKTTDTKKTTDIKKENKIIEKDNKKHVNKTVDVKKEVSKSTDFKKDVTKTVDVKKGNKSIEKSQVSTSKNVSKEISKTSELKKEIKNVEVALDRSADIKKNLTVSVEKNKKEVVKATENLKKINNKLLESKKSSTNVSSDKTVKNTEEKTVKNDTDTSDKPKKGNKADNQVSVKKEEVKKNQPEVVLKRDININKKNVQKSIDMSEKKELPIKKDAEDTTTKKETSNDKVKKEIPKKEEIVKKDVPKKKVPEPLEEDQGTPKTAQRPSRKTKEAAAIYMEILSHKLVNDSKIDDDNISIDSFPELPNVKKTEQRENELKAQAKSTKDDTKEKPKVDVEIDVKNVEISVSSTNLKQSKVKTSNVAVKRVIEDKKPSENQKIKKKPTVETVVSEDVENKKLSKAVENVLKVEKAKSDTGIQPKCKKAETETIDNKIEIKVVCKKQPLPVVEVKKVQVAKKKSTTEENAAVEPDIKSKPKKPEESKQSNTPIVLKEVKKDSISEPDNVKRQTRNSSLANKKEDNSDDSDESFHVDIKVPRKKKLTRSKVVKKPVDSITEPVVKTTITKSDKSKDKYSSSDSDNSSTSDINLQTLVNKVKNKKFSKTKSTPKPDMEFSDSDEEPLAKLTNKSVEGTQKSNISCEDNKSKSEPKVISKPVVKSKKAATKPETEVETVKPKRECAKRPQNYLPMLSSSDEDDIFHGFDEKTEEKTTKPLIPSEPSCSHAPPLLDLLSKDIGRRFGKEKVNMSNEQIEKWLKDSALAGSSIKKENDEMLKFGERIPTETTLETVEHIDTQTLKSSLLDINVVKKDVQETVVATESNSTPLKIDTQTVNRAKPQVADRKLIFRKSRKDSAPNINAFSPENESSVYAFGEDNEDMINTPFRRPSRRPSSTATSRSEDESSRHDDAFKTGHFLKPPMKQDISKGAISKDESDTNVDTDESSHHFYIPQKPSKHGFSKANMGSLQKSKPDNKHVTKPAKSGDRLLDLDDFKYKIPSSPSASSSSSAKLYKRQTQKQKVRPPETISPIYVSDFPKKTDSAKLVEAPVFHPTDQEFQDPLEYIERIRHKAEQFGICRIVPPSSFKPECKVTDDMRFTAYNQYVHKMLHRWGPNFKELMAIKKYLETQNISLTQPPWIGGMEIDLPRLYQTVQSLGGLKEVIEKKKWPRVSELMKIPKSAQDRVTKLDDIYCKYLLPYDTLSPAEREKLFDEVETEWAKRESKGLLKAQQKLATQDANEGDSDPEENDVEECITKGRNIALNAFYRIARNTMSMYFKNTEPTAQEVEQEYWKHVTLRQNHICVHSGSIDSGSWGYGFAVSKNSPFARHPWNLKVLTNNSGSVLRSLGPIMGVTVPTLHVGMVFSACCWYRDPHGLPWIEYLHTGGNKIWYGIPNSASDMFHASLTKLAPNYCKNKDLWLPSDTVMVPPGLLVENNVSLCRTVQDPGQFVVVFPKAFTSSISTGYVVSESVYFAPPYWLKTARQLFDDLKISREPSMFSLDRLLVSIVSDARCSPDILRQIIPLVQELCDNEKDKRGKLKGYGVMENERMPMPEANNRKKKRLQGEEGDYECEVCRMNLFMSMVFDTQEAVTYCLDHAITMIENKKSQVANCKFMFTYDDAELDALPKKIQTAIENKLQKRVPSKYAGMPTLLK